MHRQVEAARPVTMAAARTWAARPSTRSGPLHWCRVACRGGVCSWAAPGATSLGSRPFSGAATGEASPNPAVGMDVPKDGRQVPTLPEVLLLSNGM